MSRRFPCCSTRRRETPLQASATEAASNSQRRAVSAAAASGNSPDGFRERTLTEAFWNAFDAQKPLHVPDVVAQPEDYVEFDDFVAGLVRGSDTGQTTALKHGEPFMRDSFYLAYLDNASLSLSEAELFFPGVLDLCQAMAADFDYVTARVLLSNASQRDCVFKDDSDILVLFITGERKLLITRPIQGLPVTAPRPPPLLQCLARPGDVVYIPAGVNSRAELPAALAKQGETDGQPSRAPALMLCLQVRQAHLSVGYSLGKYLEDLLREGGLSEDTDGFFRSAVTRHTLPQRARGLKGGPARVPDGEEVQARLQQCTEELCSKLTMDGLDKHFEQRMEKMRDEQRESAVRAASSKSPLPPGVIFSRSCVRITPGIRCECEVGASSALFKRGSDSLNLPIAQSASRLINHLSDGEAHTVESLPCDDPFERLCVCQILIFKDCLEIAAGGPDEALGGQGAPS